MIPQPELDDGKFGENARKVLLPFSTELWLLTIGTILVYASLSLYLSPSQFFRPQDKDGAGSRSTTLQSKVRRVMDALLGSASVGFVEFMGAGVDHSMEGTCGKTRRIIVPVIIHLGLIANTIHCFFFFFDSEHAATICQLWICLLRVYISVSGHAVAHFPFSTHTFSTVSFGA